MRRLLLVLTTLASTAAWEVVPDAPYCAVSSTRYTPTHLSEPFASWSRLDTPLSNASIVDTAVGGSNGESVVAIRADGRLVCCQNISDLSRGCQLGEGDHSSSRLAGSAANYQFYLASSEGASLVDFGSCRTTNPLSATIDIGLVHAAYLTQGKLLVAADTGFYAYAQDDLVSPSWSITDICGPVEEPVLSVACHDVQNGDMASQATVCLVGSRSCLAWVQVTAKSGSVVRRKWGTDLDGPPVAAAFTRGSFWIATPRSLNLFSIIPNYFRSIPPAGTWTRFAGGTSNLPAANISAVAAVGGTCGSSMLLVATDQGVVVADVTFDTGVSFDLLAGPRWVSTDLPVAAIHGLTSASAAGHALVTTAGGTGLSVLSFFNQTLWQKAAGFQNTIVPRHIRPKTGLISDLPLRQFGAVATAEAQAPDDNHGLWTASYMAAQSFRAIVGSQDELDEARQSALSALAAVQRLVNVTGVRGFPARTMVPDASLRSNSHWGWNRSPTHEGWWFIGNTSSDEMTGHFFGLGVFLDAAAQGVFDDSDAERARRLQIDMLDRIVTHGLVLLDVDGVTRTRWGVWDPADLNNDISWGDERGLNSLQILSYLLSALKHRPVDGSTSSSDRLAYERFAATASMLLSKARYDLNIINQKITNPAEINFPDNSLSFLPFYMTASACEFGIPTERSEASRSRSSGNITLAALCKTIAPSFRASLRRSYRVVAPIKSALYDVIAAVADPALADASVAQAISTFREYPASLVVWPTDNSRRIDLYENKAMLPTFSRSVIALPRHQSAALRWCKDPFQFVGGDGMREEDPTFFLLPYWMARYYKLLTGDAGRSSSSTKDT